MSNPSHYTVGWICALTCEYVAAQEFLDEEHDPPHSLQPNDTNDYTLGRIGRHNIVVAVLPDGEYGTATAASVARGMLNSFPNVRIGLMVGIGGGAPSPTNDIRLGDIVVSAPRVANGVTYGGVFEYDFGKTIQDQEFQVTRFLNQPPPTLRAAVRGLEAWYTRKGHQLGQAVSDVISKNPMLQDKYSRPHSSTDVLFRSNFTHDSRGCAEFCSKDPSSLESRPQRTIYHEKPYIHHGTIASANQLMRDATIRDRLAKDRNVLCFEMEAAGLMNIFPCLVIRGICDYSDSHKNKSWQGYAAMVAAAYAKDLLNRIVPSRIENEQRMSEMLSTTLHAVENTGETVGVIKSRSDREKELEMLNWLTAIDYGPQQSDIFRRHQPGTVQWVLDSHQFQQWIATRGKTLFCPGIPGAGKTIVASVVISHLIEKLREDPSSGLAYIYCDFRRKKEQTVQHFASSMLKQLAEKHPTLPDPVQRLHEYHVRQRTRPSLGELLESLHRITEPFSRVFIVVDALDECQESDNCLSTFLSGLFDLQQKLEINIFATTRPLGHIKSRFEKAITMEIRAQSDDVRKYVNGRLGELPRIVQRDPELQEAVIGTISRAVDGMFLLAQLHFESLIGKMTAKVIRTTLESLPTGSKAYDSAYEEAMNRVQDQNKDKRDMAQKALLWITCAKERLTKPELQEALAVEPGETNLDQDNLPNMEDVASVCAGLITVDEESDVVRLVHYTAQDFFERTRRDWFKDAESHIAEVCLTYLLFKRLQGGRDDKEWQSKIPLQRYAARNWGHHVRDASLQKHRQVIAFLESGDSLQASVRPFSETWGFPVTTGLHLATYFGLDETVEALLQRGHDPNVISGNSYVPLISAIQHGHDKVAKVLLSGQANPNLPDRQGKTPLWWAVYEGYNDIVKLLMEKGANPHHRDQIGRTALGVACQRGHTSVVEALLPGAQIDFRCLRLATLAMPLLSAVGHGHVGVVEVLLNKGAAAGLGPYWSQIVLSRAVKTGHPKLVQLLLRRRANSHQCRISLQLPVKIATKRGYADIIEMLLAEGADPNDVDYWKNRI
ncbi:NACHT domain-containing protein [Fusarium falciforme]|uniref:NACHT domain-containing protein n=1 Tax=Fusarium falciforme TaxID=195108 RepID=UPI002301CF56|nr:NACHT domain-containing protein [Fusarium falciforme]WAO90276.1 NACHT domain-containing protein [Fusarium falciforme]